MGKNLNGCGKLRKKNFLIKASCNILMYRCWGLRKWFGDAIGFFLGADIPISYENQQMKTWGLVGIGHPKILTKSQVFAK